MRAKAHLGPQAGSQPASRDLKGQIAHHESAQYPAHLLGGELELLLDGGVGDGDAVTGEVGAGGGQGQQAQHAVANAGWPCRSGGVGSGVGIGLDFHGLDPPQGIGAETKPIHRAWQGRGRHADAANAPLPLPLIVTHEARCLPPTGSTAGSALVSPTLPQGGSDVEACTRLLARYLSKV